jgi:hypothetical protein
VLRARYRSVYRIRFVLEFIVALQVPIPRVDRVGTSAKLFSDARSALVPTPPTAAEAVPATTRHVAASATFVRVPPIRFPFP